MTRMRVPACGPSGQPDVAQDSSVGQSLRLLRRQPDLGILVLSLPRAWQNEFVKDIECIELALGDRCTRESLARGRQGGACKKKGRDQDRGTQQHMPRQLSSHIGLLLCGIPLHLKRLVSRVTLLRKDAECRVSRAI